MSCCCVVLGCGYVRHRPLSGAEQGLDVAAWPGYPSLFMGFCSQQLPARTNLALGERSSLRSYCLFLVPSKDRPFLEEIIKDLRFNYLGTPLGWFFMRGRGPRVNRSRDEGL